jgi:hypothetical protein
MNRSTRRIRPQKQAVTLSDRIVSAILTPVFFNIFLVIVIAINSSSMQFARHIRSIYGASAMAVYVMLLLPALTEFIAGSSGTAKIVGHAFWTNHDAEKSVLATAAVWLCVGSLLLFADNIAGP